MMLSKKSCVQIQQLLTIAHRLATIRRADWIIVLSSEGEVAEQGTYAQLSRKPKRSIQQINANANGRI